MCVGVFYLEGTLRVNHGFILLYITKTESRRIDFAYLLVFIPAWRVIKCERREIKDKQALCFVLRHMRESSLLCVFEALF